MDDFVEEIVWSTLFAYLVFCGLVSFFLLLERFFAAGTQKSFLGNFLNLKIAFLNVSFGVAIDGLLRGYMMAWLSNLPGMGLIDLAGYAASGIVPLILAFILFIFIDDFFFYWMHRFQHKNIFLWQEHKLHHLDEQLNSTSTGRVHWLESVIQWPLKTLPIAIIFKMDPVQGMAFGLLSAGWIVFIHSNLRVDLGLFTKWITGPQVHRLHHSRLYEHRDRNFAAIFPVFDIAFGTYYQPKRDEYPPTGVDGEVDVATLGESAILPFKGWAKVLEEKFKKKHGPEVPQEVTHE